MMCIKVLSAGSARWQNKKQRGQNMNQVLNAIIAKRNQLLTLILFVGHVVNLVITSKARIESVATVNAKEKTWP
ncbi:MAG: hypothetical protein OXC46_03050 [Thaumarchaeota archaeon]|nr:hypothetical protein [Nitrososphaerota archaeon]